MEESILIRYRFNYREYRQAIAVAHRPRRMTYLFWQIGLYILVLCFPFSLLIYSHIMPRYDAATIIGLTVFYAIIYLFVKRGIRKSQRMEFEKSVAKDDNIEYVISSDTISINSAHAQSILRWDLISKVYQAKEGFLLFEHSTAVRWLPRDGFVDATAIEAVAALAKSKVADYRVL